jgi:hypothetical protein
MTNSPKLRYYARPETLQKLRKASNQVVFLVGGFAGIFNFGDMAQLASAITWHRQMKPLTMICAFVHVHAFSPELSIEPFERTFGLDDWIFYHYEDDKPGSLERIAHLGLSVLKPEQIRAAIFMHFYGGGRLNQFWGMRTLSLLQDLLKIPVSKSYLISGQQVSPEFAHLFAEHVRQAGPGLVGCRDEQSLRLLAAERVKAVFSGDDSLEYIQASLPTGSSASDTPQIWGLNTRQTIFTNSQDGLSFQPWLEQFARRIESGGEVLFLQTFSAQKQTFLSLEPLPFAGCECRQLTQANLADAMLDGKLPSMFANLSRLTLAVVMSYHLAVVLKFLRVPVYLLGRNDFYHQKQETLWQPVVSVEDFLASTASRLLDWARDGWVEHNVSARQAWLARCEKHFFAPRWFGFLGSKRV